MLSFNAPTWFALYLFFPFLLWARFFWRQRGGRILFPYKVWGGEGFTPPYTWLRFFLFVLGFASWIGGVLLVFALAGPEWNEREEIYLSRGIDIMIVLDQSPSMAARDFPPLNRFDTARNMIRHFLTGRSGDSIGLVGFGSNAVLRSPPTTDYDWFLLRLNELEIRELGDGTAIGMGLAVATLHLTDSSAPQKIILLLTDGDNNAGEISPETAAMLAKEYNIRVYSIGIGSEGEVPIELHNAEDGGIIRGNMRTHFDEKQLQLLAEITEGDYWRASSPGALETVLQNIDVLEAVQRHVSVRVNVRPIHHPLLLWGLFLILIPYLIRKGLLGELP